MTSLIHTLPNAAAEIDAEHAKAIQNAAQAVEHAKRAGELLLQVKAALPHGDFLPWIEENVSVSARQAQRYMAAAVGKLFPIRHTALLKNDTVSHLGWLPKNGELAKATLATCDAEWLFVQEVVHAPGCFYIAYCGIASIDWTKRGIPSDYVEEIILDWLPGRYTRKQTISEFAWEYFDGKDWLRDNIVKPFNEMNHADSIGGRE